jgi:hypothetical protein
MKVCPWEWNLTARGGEAGHPNLGDGNWQAGRGFAAYRDDDTKKRNVVIDDATGREKSIQSRQYKSYDRNYNVYGLTMQFDLSYDILSLNSPECGMFTSGDSNAGSPAYLPPSH